MRIGNVAIRINDGAEKSMVVGDSCKSLGVGNR